MLLCCESTLADCRAKTKAGITRYLAFIYYAAAVAKLETVAHQELRVKTKSCNAVLTTILNSI